MISEPPALDIREVGWDHPDAVRLRAAQEAEIRDRYQMDEPEPGVHPSAADMTCFYVAYVDGEAVACGGSRAIDAEHGEIKRMYVVPERRGSGLAPAVLVALEDDARARGWTRLVLETGTSQPEAVRLYEREGYRSIPLFGDYIGETTSLCFEKALSPVKSRRRRILPFAIGGGALLAGGLAVASAALGAAHEPTKPVVAYLDDIVAGHVEDAVARLENGPRSPLLDDDVYAATDDRITGYTIGEVSESGTTATVTVELTTASRTLTENVPLVSTGTDLLWQRWAVDGEKLPEVDIAWFTPDGYDLAVNGVALPGVSGRQHLAALPGSYDFTPAAQSEVVTAEPVTATVDRFSRAGDASVATTVVLTEEGEAQARKALTAFINGCVKQHVLSPKGGCGFGILSNGGKYPTLNWSITRRPQVTFGAFDGFGFDVVTTKTGVFKLTGQNSSSIITGIIDDYEYYGFMSLAADDSVTYTSRYEG